MTHLTHVAASQTQANFTCYYNFASLVRSNITCRQFGEMYSALQLTSGARESFGGGPACWFLLHQLLLTGDIQRAYMLLTAHLQSQSPNQITLDEECEHFVLENLAHNLMAMPRYSAESYSSMEMFHHQHSEWTSSLEQWEDSLPVRTRPNTCLLIHPRAVARHTS